MVEGKGVRLMDKVAIITGGSGFTDSFPTNNSSIDVS